MPDNAISRRGRITLTAVIAALLLAAASSVYLRQDPSEVTVGDAVAAFRSTSQSSPASTSAADGSPSAGTGPSDGVGPGGTATTPSSAAEPASRPSDQATTAPAAATATTPVTARAAATERASAPSAPPSSSASPAAEPELQEGVYTFATEGFEATNALGGARHDYPKETPVTLRRSECGWTQRWQPLRERWDESAMCRTDVGLDVRTFTTYHEFFQKSQQQQFDCPEGSSVFRRDAPAGATWSWRCTAGSSAIDTVVTVVGPEAVVVEGREVPATKVHYESTLTGANRGTQVQDRWIRSDGLNLRIKTDIDAQSDSPFGVVHYEEHYVTTLAQLEPRR